LEESASSIVRAPTLETVTLKDVGYYEILLYHGTRYALSVHNGRNEPNPRGEVHERRKSTGKKLSVHAISLLKLQFFTSDIGARIDTRSKSSGERRYKTSRAISDQ
jgi:hypothetical protein